MTLCTQTDHLDLTANAFRLLIQETRQRLNNILQNLRLGPLLCHPDFTKDIFTDFGHAVQICDGDTQIIVCIDLYRQNIEQLLGSGSANLHITKEDLTTMFRFIYMDWNTGET